MHLKVRYSALVILAVVILLYLKYFIPYYGAKRGVKIRFSETDSNKPEFETQDYSNLLPQVSLHYDFEESPVRNLSALASRWAKKPRSSFKVHKSCLLQDCCEALTLLPITEESCLRNKTEPKERLKITIALFSHSDHFNIRTISRYIFSNLKSKLEETLDVSYFYVVSLSKNETINSKVLKENEASKDILILNILESPKLEVFKFFAFAQEFSKYCKHFDLLIRTEDIAFMMPQKLTHFVDLLRAKHGLSNVYSGMPVYTDYVPIGLGTKGSIFPDSFPKTKRYPPFAHKTFQIFSRDVLKMLINCGEACFTNEGAYIGNCLKGSVPMISAPGLQRLNDSEHWGPVAPCDFINNYLFVLDKNNLHTYARDIKTQVHAICDRLLQY